MENEKLVCCDGCMEMVPASDISGSWGYAKLCYVCDAQVQDDMKDILGDDAMEGF